MYGIGAGCPGADVLGHRRMGRLTLEHRLNHPRPKEIVTFTSSVYYSAPVGVTLSEVLLVGGGQNGQDGKPPVSNPYVENTYNCGDGGRGGRGGTFLSTQAALTAKILDVIIGASWSLVGAATVSSFGELVSNGVGCTWRPERSGGGGDYYNFGTGTFVVATPGVASPAGFMLFNGVKVGASGSGGGGGCGSGNYGVGGRGDDASANGGNGAWIDTFYPSYPVLHDAVNGGNAMASGGGGGGGGGGCRHYSNYPSLIGSWKPGGLGAAGVVQLRFRREF